MTARRCFLYSPASSYPTPYAAVIDETGQTLHRWQNPVGQPALSTEPASFLRGWNHVELDRNGHLYVIVPLHAVVKLDTRSRIIWSAEVSAHHDLAVDEQRRVHVLTESPRRVVVRGCPHVIIDNEITVLSPEGSLIDVVSLYDIVTQDVILGDVLCTEIRRRATPLSDLTRAAPLTSHQTPHTFDEVLHTGKYSGDKRSALTRLRLLPGSPCDVLHANTVELIGQNRGRWQPGQVIVSLRELDLVLVIDVAARSVGWAWGRGVVSGQHQPSLQDDGNLLVFDNGRYTGRSRVLEIEPHGPSLVWSYDPDPPHSFHSPVAGGCERLPDGDVLVTDAHAGRAFTVDRRGSVTWRWDAPAPSHRSARSRASLYRVSLVHHDIVRRLGGACD